MSDTRFDEVLRILSTEGVVSQKTRHALQQVLAAIPPGEQVIDAYRCSILSGTAGLDGVAVLTSERLSAFERRGFRSPDQKLQITLAKPFSVEPGPGATRVTLAAAGARPTTLELFEADRAEALRDELAALRSAREEGWWSQASVPWPGWLGQAPAWSYLGGDPHLPHPALDLRVQVGPAGFTLGDSDGSLAPLAPWSVVSQLLVIGPEQAFERAATRGLLVADGFAGAWRSADWTAFIVLGYFTGEEVFLGTAGLTEADLRNRLVRVAQAMPAGNRQGPPPVALEEPALPEPAADTSAAVTPSPAPTPSPTPSAAVIPSAAVTPPAAATPSEPQSEAPAYSLAEQLERLGALHRQGLLDEDEFARAKAALLRG